MADANVPDRYVCRGTLTNYAGTPLPFISVGISVDLVPTNASIRIDLSPEFNQALVQSRAIAAAGYVGPLFSLTATNSIPTGLGGSGRISVTVLATNASGEITSELPFLIGEPVLTIVQAANAVDVSWPDVFDGGLLQRSEAIALGTSWSPVNQVPIYFESQRTIQVANTGSGAVFRLVFTGMPQFILGSGSGHVGGFQAGKPEDQR